MFSVFLLVSSSPALSQEPIRVGMINDLTGRHADAGVQLDNGAKAALKNCGRAIHIIRRDTGGPAPDLARRLARDLVLRDRVHILAGFLLAPNATAAAEVSTKEKVFMVVMHAPGADIAGRSPYVIRTALGGPYDGGFDGMTAICEALRRTGGRTDADSLLAAVKGMRWDSPRGPVTLDPETRELR